MARNDPFGRLAKSAGVRRNPHEYAGTGAIGQESPAENGRSELPNGDPGAFRLIHSRWFGVLRRLQERSRWRVGLGRETLGDVLQTSGCRMNRLQRLGIGVRSQHTEQLSFRPSNFVSQ